jgi:hypothetical protein
MTRRVLACAASAALFSVYSTSVFATPYASGVSESGGTVTFRLNEAADTVTVIRDGVPDVIGALPAGTASFARNGAANYQIKVTRQSGPGYLTKAPGIGSFSQGVGLRYSDESNKQLWFTQPRSVAVDTSPASPYFGRIYVGNTTAGSVTFNAVTRNIGDGLYAVNADGTDAINQGDTAQSGGIDWTLSANSPWKMTVGPDNKVYISDWSDAHAGIYRVDSDLTNGVSILKGQGDGNPTSAATPPAGWSPETSVHGSIASRVILEGSGANMKIYAIDEDMVGTPPVAYPSPTPNPADIYQGLYRWDVGTATDYAGAPTRIADFPDAVTRQTRGVTVDLARGTDGKFFLSQRRVDGTEAGLYVLSSDGQTVLWDSLTATRQLTGNATATDFLKESWTQQMSPDGKFLVLSQINSDFYLVPIDQSTGLPDLSKAKYMDVGVTNQSRDITIDAAGNVYLATSGHSRVRMFSPGGLSETIYNSNGTFSKTVSNDNPTWALSGGGQMGTSGNWLNNFVPSGAGWSATFGDNITSPGTIDVGAGTFTTGSIWIDTASTLSFGGTGTLAFSSPAATGFVVSRGNHAVTAPLSIGSNFATTVGSNSFSIGQGTVTTVNTMGFNTGPGGTISVGGITVTATATAGTTASAFVFNVGTAGVVTLPINSQTNNVSFSGTLLTGANVTISDAPRVSNINLNTGTSSTFNIASVTYGTIRFSVTKSGAGTLLIPRTNASTLTINAGTTRLTGNGATSVCNVCTISTQDGMAAGTLDIGNQRMVIDYPVAPAISPLLQIRQYLENAYANGSWTGPGITSSNARDSLSQTNKGALAYFEAVQNGTTNFGGVTTDTSAICLMYTSQGDATLDGKTDTMDFNVLAHNFGASGKTSIEGEFTYDETGTVDSSDFNVLVGGFGSKITLSAPTLGGLVPEPASLSLLAAGAMLARRRR